MPLGLDTILWLIGLLAEVAVVVLCVRGKLYRITPVFCSYLAWSLLVDAVFPLLSRSLTYTSPTYFRIYWIQMVLDSIFQFAVLVELGWAVLRPIRSSLPRHSVVMLALMFVAAGAVIWPVSAHMIPAGKL